MARVERSAWLTGALLIACAQRIAAPPPPVAVAPAASTPLETSVEPARPPAPKLELSGDVACRFRNRVAYSASEDPLRLCVSADGPCFIENSRALMHLDNSVTIGIGEDPPALLEVEHQGFVLRGLTRAKRIQLFVKRPQLLAQFVVPTTVYVEAGRADALVVGADVAPFEPKTPVQGSLSCAQLTLYSDWHSFEDRIAIAGIHGKSTRRVLVGSTIPLSTDPGGPPVVELKPGPTVDAFETRGGSTHSVLGADTGSLVIGWIPNRALRSAPPGSVGSGSSGSGKTYVVAPEKNLPYRCPHDVELAIEVDRSRYRVGRIKAGSPFRALDSVDRDYVAIALPVRILEEADTRNDRREDQVLRLLPGAALMAPQSSIRGCRT